MIKKLDWEDIKFLGAVASHRTVRATAKQLNVHHSTVSRRIESLEHAAQTRLVFRTTEGYCLTEAGELLANSASVMDAEVSRAQRLIYGGDKDGWRVIVTVTHQIWYSRCIRGISGASGMYFFTSLCHFLHTL